MKKYYVFSYNKLKTITESWHNAAKSCYREKTITYAGSYTEAVNLLLSGQNYK